MSNDSSLLAHVLRRRASVYIELSQFHYALTDCNRAKDLVDELLLMDDSGGGWNFLRMGKLLYLRARAQYRLAKSDETKFVSTMSLIDSSLGDLEDAEDYLQKVPAAETNSDECKSVWKSISDLKNDVNGEILLLKGAGGGGGSGKGSSRSEPAPEARDDSNNNNNINSAEPGKAHASTRSSTASVLCPFPSWRP